MDGILSFFEALRRIRTSTGKSITKQCAEIASLRFGRNPIGISEYLDYGIWSSSLTAKERGDFLGWRQSAALDSRLNDNWARALANDKLLTYLILSAQSLPIPKAIATYNRDGRRIGGEKSLRCRDDVIDFLSGDVFPFFAKPISAGYGRGVQGVSGWAANGTDLCLRDGRQVTLDTFLSDFDLPQYGGKLFQECLEPHPAIVRVTGTKAISCVRFICFVCDGEVMIHTAFWKIATGTNMLDNFSHGDFGNCLGWIDVESGEVVSAIAKMGVGGEIELHPTSGERLVGFVLPDWNQAKELVRAAAVHFPGLHLQNWDLALCADGPVLVEVNTESELAVPQAICKRGLMDECLRAIVAKF